MPPRPIHRSLLLAVLLLLGVAFSGEWAVRRWLMRPQAVVLDGTLGFLQRPGSRVVQSREGWGEFTANSRGVLDHELRPGPGGTVGVLMGDSFGQGLQVRADQRFSEVTETLLPGVSIVNMASAGRSPIHYALFAPRLEAEFHPDFFVLQLNDGDLSELESGDLWRAALDEFHGVGGPRPPGTGLAGRARSILRYSGLLNMLSFRVALLAGQERTRLKSKLTGSHPDMRDVVALPVTARAAALADSLIAVVQAVEPRLVLVYVPHIAYFGSPAREAYPERRRFYHALAARLGLPLVDPTDALLESYARDHEPLHGFRNTRPGEGHLNARGHAVVGRLLAAELERERRPGQRLAVAPPARPARAGR